MFLSDFYAKRKEFNSAKKKSFLVAMQVANELKLVIKQAKDELAYYASDLYENSHLGYDVSEFNDYLHEYESDIIQAEKELNRFFSYANH